MASTLSPPVSEHGARPVAARAARPLPPIKLWAWIGAGVLTLMTYTVVRWIVSGDATPTDTGATPVPSWMKTMAMSQQAVFAAASLALGYVVVIRERRCAGHLTLNGMSYIVIQTAWWQDSFLNFITPQMSYNSALVNFGSWDASLPGWVSPHAELMPSPVLWYFGVYPLLFCGGTIGVLWLMGRAQARWGVSTLALIAGTFATLSVFAFTFEFFFVRTGMYHYAGFGGPRLLPGHWYTFPIFVPILDAAIWTAWAAILYFRNDRGETVAERGADQLRVGARARTGVRLVALIGVCHVAYAVCYNVPVQMLGLHANAWPREVQERSYFTNGLCGPRTDTACPSGSVPIPRGDGSLRVGPDGRLRAP